MTARFAEQYDQNFGLTGVRTMLAVRLAKKEWGKAWRALIEVGPVRLVADDPVYEVLPAHLHLLNARGLSYEVVKFESDFKGSSQSKR